MISNPLIEQLNKDCVASIYSMMLGIRSTEGDSDVINAWEDNENYYFKCSCRLNDDVRTNTINKYRSRDIKQIEVIQGKLILNKKTQHIQIEFINQFFSQNDIKIAEYVYGVNNNFKNNRYGLMLYDVLTDKDTTMKDYTFIFFKRKRYKDILTRDNLEYIGIANANLVDPHCLRAEASNNFKIEGIPYKCYCTYKQALIFRMRRNFKNQYGDTWKVIEHQWLNDIEQLLKHFKIV